MPSRFILFQFHSLLQVCFQLTFGELFGRGQFGILRAGLGMNRSRCSRCIVVVVVVVVVVVIRRRAVVVVVMVVMVGEDVA
jgi:hypothetical protein